MQPLEKIIADFAKKYHDKYDWDVPVDYFHWQRDVRYSNPSPHWSMKLRSKLSIDEIMEKFHQEFSECETSYPLLSDDYSRRLFAEYVYLKIVGETRMRLSSFTHEFINSYELNCQKIYHDLSKTFPNMLTSKVYKVYLEEYGITVFSTPETYNVIKTSRLYQYNQGDVSINLEPGDVVLDAGAGVGDTVVYFASIVSQKSGGKIYTFDIHKDNFECLENQLQQNLHLQDFITPVLRAVWDKDGVKLLASEPGVGSGIVRKNPRNDHNIEVTTIKIDSFVKENNLTKVDMIKMDIEGAEVPALEGARETIKKYKPKLAICVYHKDSDLWLIPNLINEIRDDYEFYLDSYTGFGGETILYCR